MSENGSSMCVCVRMGVVCVFEGNKSSLCISGLSIEIDKNGSCLSVCVKMRVIVRVSE